MICYSPMPQANYCVKTTIKKPKFLSKIPTGLGDPDFITDSAFWNYLVITSKLPFLWEDKKVKLIDKPAKFPHLEDARYDFDNCFIGAVPVKALVSMLAPELFLEKALTESLVHLRMSKFFGGEQQLRIVIRARVAAYLGDKASAEDKAVMEMVKNQI